MRDADGGLLSDTRERLAGEGDEDAKSIAMGERGECGGSIFTRTLPASVTMSSVGSGSWLASAVTTDGARLTWKVPVGQMLLLLELWLREGIRKCDRITLPAAMLTMGMRY